MSRFKVEILLNGYSLGFLYKRDKDICMGGKETEAIKYSSLEEVGYVHKDYKIKRHYL